MSEPQTCLLAFSRDGLYFQPFNPLSVEPFLGVLFFHRNELGQT